MDKSVKKQEKPKKNNSQKLSKLELKKIKAARKARAKARSSTKLSVRIIGLSLALIMLAAFVVPGAMMVYKTFFGARSGLDSTMHEEEMQRLLEELAKMQAASKAEEGAAEEGESAEGNEEAETGGESNEDAATEQNDSSEQAD